MEDADNVSEAESIVRCFAGMQFNEIAHKRIHNLPEECSVKSMFSESVVRGAIPRVYKLYKGNWEAIKSRGFQFILDSVHEESRRKVLPTLQSCNVDRTQELGDLKRKMLVKNRTGKRPKIDNHKDTDNGAGPSTRELEIDANFYEKQAAVNCIADKPFIQESDIENNLVRGTCDASIAEEQPSSSGEFVERPPSDVNEYSHSLRHVVESMPDKPSIAESGQKVLCCSDNVLPVTCCIPSTGEPSTDWCIIAEGLSDVLDITSDKLRDFVESVCHQKGNAEIVPARTMAVKEAAVSTEAGATITFSSGVMAELFYSACCTPFVAFGKTDIKLRRTYSPSRVPFLKQLRAISYSSRLIYVSGAAECWGEENRVRRYFEEILKDAGLEKCVGSIYTLPGRADCFMELASDLLVDLVFYRCRKGLGTIGKDAFMCRSKKLVEHLLELGQNVEFEVEGNCPAGNPDEADRQLALAAPAASGKSGESECEPSSRGGGNRVQSQEPLRKADVTIADYHKAQNSRIYELPPGFSGRSVKTSRKLYQGLSQIHKTGLQNPHQVTLYISRLPERYEIEELRCILETASGQCIECTQHLKGNSALVEFGTETDTDRFMDAYIERTSKFYKQNFPMCIYRSFCYVRPGAVNKRNRPPARAKQLEGIVVTGLPDNFSSDLLRGAVSELLDRAFAPYSSVLEYGRNLLKYFSYRSSGHAFLEFNSSSALEAVLSLEPQQLDGKLLKFIRKSDFYRDGKRTKFKEAGDDGNKTKFEESWGSFPRQMYSHYEENRHSEFTPPRYASARRRPSRFDRCDSEFMGRVGAGHYYTAYSPTRNEKSKFSDWPHPEIEGSETLHFSPTRRSSTFSDSSNSEHEYWQYSPTSSSRGLREVEFEDSPAWRRPGTLSDLYIPGIENRRAHFGDGPRIDSATRPSKFSCAPPPMYLSDVMDGRRSKADTMLQ